MSASLTSFRAETSRWEPKFPFDIFVAYDDDITREHALVLKDRLSDVLKDDFDVCCSWWKFHCMLQPELLDRAVDAVVNADMIVVSVHGNRPLPVIAQTWMERWLTVKDGHNCALAALVEPNGRPEHELLGVLNYLRSMAHRTDMDFFWHTATSPVTLPAFTARNLSERETAITPLLAEILEQPFGNSYWGWGIND